MNAIHRLFVYGSLAPGRPNAHVLAPLQGVWERATVRGRLMQQGWGAAMGYPACVPDKDGDDVQGFLFTAQKLDSAWGNLDALEGAEYVRVVVDVRRADGSTVTAYIYALADG